MRFYFEPVGAYDFPVDPLNKVSPNSNSPWFQIQWENLEYIVLVPWENRTKQNVLGGGLRFKVLFRENEGFPQEKQNKYSGLCETQL